MAVGIEDAGGGQLCQVRAFGAAVGDVRLHREHVQVQEQVVTGLEVGADNAEVDVPALAAVVAQPRLELHVVADERAVAVAVDEVALDGGQRQREGAALLGDHVDRAGQRREQAERGAEQLAWLGRVHGCVYRPRTPIA